MPLEVKIKEKGRLLRTETALERFPRTETALERLPLECCEERERERERYGVGSVLWQCENTHG